MPRCTRALLVALALVPLTAAAGGTDRAELGLSLTIPARVSVETTETGRACVRTNDVAGRLAAKFGNGRVLPGCAEIVDEQEADLRRSSPDNGVIWIVAT